LKTKGIASPQTCAGAALLRGAGDVLYYSFITVGYGDVTPASPLARSLSLIEAVVGIMRAATMIARFVSIQTGSDQRAAKPADAAPDATAS
jgi:Ion channel